MSSGEQAVRVWQVSSGGTVFTNETADFNSSTNADFEPFGVGAVADDFVAIGSRSRFSRVIFDNANGTAGATGVVTWQYWNGSTWTALAGVTDGTSGFTAAVSDGQILRYTEPSDWALRTLSDAVSLYYIRALLSATVYTVQPVYDQGFVVQPSFESLKLGSELTELDRVVPNSHGRSYGILDLQTRDPLNRGETEQVYATGAAFAGVAGLVGSYYQRIFDNTLGVYVYYNLAQVTDSPASAVTTPNHTGNLAANTHAVLGLVFEAQ